MIVFEDATLLFPKAEKPALDSISATVKPGKITGLVGPDGAGKTTALRLIAGLLTPTSGRVTAFGYDAAKQTARVRELLGYMPQKFGLYEDLTVMENLNLYAKLRNLPRSQRKERFDELLEFTNLTRFTKRLARRLSGGMKQKLGLACALITTPRLLVLDEPGVGVDPLSRRELWRMVKERVAPDTVAIWSTAYLDEAELCDETILLNEGKLLFSGAPKELTRGMESRVVRVLNVDPGERRREVANLLKKEEIVDATIQGGSIRVTLSRAFDAARDPKALFGGRRVELTRPRFEDGFIERLGGAPKDDGANERTFARKPSVDAVVVANGLTKKFGDFTAASDVGFKIKPGEIFGLLGPNGAGKSTTFKMLCGLLRPTKGEGFVGGFSLRKAPSVARSRLGYMAQKFSLYVDMTVRQNLVFYADLYGLPLLKRGSVIEQTLDEYDLRRYEHVKAGVTPLGYKQRLALATATIHNPDALFLDEPTSGVDPIARREFWNRVNRFAAQGVAVLVTTHFMDEAEYCDRLALILDGQKIAEGTPDELKSSARTPENPDPTLEDAFIRLIQQGREGGAK
ncbi:MAG: ABC transporter ATP-binding protein [Thermoguttaceae bacterium]|nr:ABC transporter ATP-binding protein [Thermoguttaceae bacterium]